MSQWVPISLAPDPVIDAYKPGIDITLLEQNLVLTVEQRLEKFLALHAFASHVIGLERLIHVKRAAGRRKDLDAVAELELLRDRLANSNKPPQE